VGRRFGCKPGTVEFKAGRKSEWEKGYQSTGGSREGKGRLAGSNVTIPLGGIRGRNEKQNQKKRTGEDFKNREYKTEQKKRDGGNLSEWTGKALGKGGNERKQKGKIGEVYVGKGKIHRPYQPKKKSVTGNRLKNAGENHNVKEGKT